MDYSATDQILVHQESRTDYRKLGAGAEAEPEYVLPTTDADDVNSDGPKSQNTGTAAAKVGAGVAAAGAAAKGGAAAGAGKQCAYKNKSGRACMVAVTPPSVYCRNHFCPECNARPKPSAVPRCEACAAAAKGLPYATPTSVGSGPSEGPYATPSALGAAAYSTPATVGADASSNSAVEPYSTPSALGEAAYSTPSTVGAPGSVAHPYSTPASLVEGDYARPRSVIDPVTVEHTTIL